MTDQSESNILSDPSTNIEYLEGKSEVNKREECNNNWRHNI